MSEHARARPGTLTGLLAALTLLVAAYRLFAPLPAGTWPVLGDSVIFEYIGWYLTQGNRLYIDAWEIKPPLAFEVTAATALLAGDSVVLHHVLNVVLTGGAVVVGAGAAAGIVHELTDDVPASIVAGMTPFVLPTYVYRSLIGFKVKYFVVAAGLGCLYLAYRRRPGVAGVAGALAVGFWQLAAIFPLVAVGHSLQVEGRRAAGRFLLGSAGTALVMVLPIVLWGAVPAMVAEVLVAPLLLVEEHTLIDRLSLLGRTLGWALAVGLVGIVGLARSVTVDERRAAWPVVLTAAWLLFVIIALDFDNRPDLFPLFAVLGVGVGLLIADGRAWKGDDRSVSGPARAGALALAAGILVAVAVAVTIGGSTVGAAGPSNADTFDTDTQIDPDYAGARTYSATERQAVYWHRIPIRNCRAFGAANQAQLVKRAGLADGRTWYEAPCGRFDPLWRALWQ